MTMLLDKDTFLLLDDSDFAFVELPEFQRDNPEPPRIRVRSLMSDQVQRYWLRASKAKETGVPVAGGLNALVCAMGMVDDKGMLMFPDENSGAVAMGRKHPEIVARIANAIWDLSNATKSQREALEKKLEATQSSDSPASSSPAATPDLAST